MEDRYTLTDLPEIFTAYYVVDWHSLIFAKGLKDFDGDGYELVTCGVIFAENAGDYSRIAAGMAFKTQEAAERNKYAVYKALTGKEWGKGIMRLTKERAITLHRRMWRWLGLKTLKEKRCVKKEEWFERFGLEWVTCGCYCCKYSRDKSYELGVYPICDNCPIDWGEIGCEDKQGQGLFGLWCGAAKDGNWQEAGKLALQIAELPEREEI